MDETAVKDYIIVYRELFERTTVDGIRIMPWTIFLDKLWNNEIFSWWEDETHKVKVAVLHKKFYYEPIAGACALLQCR